MAGKQNMVTIMEDHEDLLVVMVGQDPEGGLGGGHGGSGGGYEGPGGGPGRQGGGPGVEPLR